MGPFQHTLEQIGWVLHGLVNRLRTVGHRPSELERCHDASVVLPLLPDIFLEGAVARSFQPSA